MVLSPGYCFLLPFHNSAPILRAFPDLKIPQDGEDPRQFLNCHMILVLARSISHSVFPATSLALLMTP